MTKTENYQLNQWEPTDKFSRTDFNADNAAIDAALSKESKALTDYQTANDAAMAKKAESSAVTALENDLASTNGAVAALTAALGSGGSNCRIATGSYVGTNTYGADSPNVLTFDFQPLLVWVACGLRSSGSTPSEYEYMYLTYPVESGVASVEMDVAWGERSVQWYICGSTSSAAKQFNSKNWTYYWGALGISA